MDQLNFTEKKMKVLIVRDRKSAGGGIVNYYNTVNDYFNIDVDYAPIGRPYAFYETKKVSIFKRFTFTRLLLDYFSLMYKIAKFKPDIVLINASIDEERKSIARDSLNILISKMMGRKTIVFWRGFIGGGPQFPFKGGNKGLVCRFFKMADAFIVLARQFEDDLKRWGFKKPIFLETTTIGKELLENGAIKPRQEPQNKRSLLFLSRIEREKGIIELIDAYWLLKQKHPDFQLVIAGNGPYLKNVNDYIAKENIQDVHCLGHVTGEEKFKAFQNASIFCFPSYYGEGMPNAVLEAMALGLPLVSSDVSGLKDILEDGKNGMILRKIEPPEIADQISKLVENDELRRKISEYNKKYASEKFHPQECAKRLKIIFENVLAGAK